jgi:hypothetical protein
MPVFVKKMDLYLSLNPKSYATVLTALKSVKKSLKEFYLLVSKLYKIKTSFSKVAY